VIAFLAVGESAIVIAFAAFVLGFFASISGIFFETALQQHIPPDKLSRVAAYDITASFASIPAGVIVVGVVATRLGTVTTLWIAAIMVTLAGIATLFAQDVRSIGGSAPVEPPAVVPRATTRRTPRPTRPAPARSG
jgi:predicted MFS family arabinose efflux permease